MSLINLINMRYLAISAMIYVVLSIQVDYEMYPLYIFNMFTVMLYYSVLQSQLFKPDNYYTIGRLIRIILSYSLLYIVTYNIISYEYNQNYFVFSEIDAVRYHIESFQMSSRSIINGINIFLSRYTYEDLGVVLVISMLYKIYASNLIVNLLYFALSLLSSVGLFNIGKQLMPGKYAFLASLSFSISSYFLWFNTSGLKESIMIFLVIYSFMQYYRFLQYRKNSHLLFMALFLAPLMLFRPAVLFLILGAVLMGSLMNHRRTKTNIFSIIILLMVLSIGSTYVSALYDKFFGGGFAYMIYTKEVTGMVIRSLSFTYFVNIMAGLIGPLPTLSPTIKPVLSFYAPGLIYKTLISIPFLFGVYQIFNRKIVSYYPIAAFVVLEILSLIFILEGLELRKSLIHFPFIYLIAFGYIGFNTDTRRLNISSMKRFKNVLNLSFLGVFILMLFWNFR
jgi:hypothetical protein